MHTRILLVLTGWFMCSGAPADERADFFEALVRPLLARHCFECHGAKKQSGGIRLDSRAGILGEADSGPVVIAGAPEKSALFKAIQHVGPVKMPPRGKLPPEAVAILREWIRLGAPWPEQNNPSPKIANATQKHWAFEPIRKPAMPKVAAYPWPISDVDRFIFARLEAKGLKPSPPVDRRILLRRVTFDLIGLPPTPAEMEAYLADDAANALAKVVDRLLASPHYGERWGRHWLDVARYADTKGYVFFEESAFPWAYTYRDYVIRAFNSDLPFDRFILEQLAADQVELGADKRPLTALGFLTIGPRFMSNQHDILDDRIDVVTRGLMGFTVTCARCHDHKFDPIASSDYYGLYGVFASCAEPTIPPLFEKPPPTSIYDKFAKELEAREQRLTAFVKAKHEELTAGARKRAAEYLLAAHALRDQPSTEEFMLLADTGDLNPTMIVRWQKFLARNAKQGEPVFRAWRLFAELPEANFTEQATALCATLRERADMNPMVMKMFADLPPRNLVEAARRYGDLLTAVDERRKVRKRSLSEAEDELLDVFYGPDAPAHVALLPYGDLSLLPDRASQGKLRELRTAVETWRATGPGAPPRAMVLEDLPIVYDPHVFVRGNPNQKGDPVARQMPLALTAGKSQPFQKGSGRLELAKAIASPHNPLTARVLVNRVWMHHFGAGLVRTPSDFGVRGDPPSHPEMLDYLASTFMEDGWSIKKLHRRILLSHVYQQASDTRAEAAGVDPENRLLWRMPRRRLDFEATRDNLLAVSGRLSPLVGGPSIANGLTASTRRTLYAHLDRLNVPGLFRTFDFPMPDASNPQRDQTIIAPQALFLMNHPFVLDNARGALKRPEIAKVPDPNERIARIYRAMFQRSPTSMEAELAGRYLKQDNSPAAWERLVHALMMTNEFVTVD